MSKATKALAITTIIAGSAYAAAIATTPALAKYVGSSGVDNAAGPVFAQDYVPPQGGYYPLTPDDPAWAGQPPVNARGDRF